MMRNMDENRIRDALRRISSDTRDRGDEIDFRTCPYCGKADFKFSVNVKKQVFACSHKNSCGVTGTVFKLLCDQGIISPITKAVDRSYRRPQPDQAITVTEDFYAWYSGWRGINAETLKAFNVGLKTEENRRYIVYHYVDEHGTEVNRKYRNCADKRDMRTEKGAEQVYYGMSLLDFGQKRLIVVSGEDDVHALYQMGIRNVVSVPFGDKGYSPAMDRVNTRFPEIILLFDADEPGQAGAYSFAMKAGLHKCKNAVLPWKDARDCLLHGLDIFGIEAEIARARPFKCQEVISASDAKATTIERIFSRHYVGVMLCCSEINRILGGIRLGELSTIIAHTGCGKTTFALNLVTWAIKAGMHALVMSFENTVESVVSKLVEIRTGEAIRSYDPIAARWEIKKSREWIEQQIDELSDQDLYFLNRSAIGNGYCDVDRLVGIVEYAVKFHEVNVVLIDHLHYFLNLSGERNPVHKIDETMRAISQTAQRLKIHILLIVHPSKTADDRGQLIPVGLNSAKGASSIQQESFNFLTIARKEEEERKLAKVTILKNRTDGRVGEIVFNVRDNLNTFFTDSMQPRAEREEAWYAK
jgi:twinkle protein